MSCMLGCGTRYYIPSILYTLPLSSFQYPQIHVNVPLNLQGVFVILIDIQHLLKKMSSKLPQLEFFRYFLQCEYPSYGHPEKFFPH